MKYHLMVTSIISKKLRIIDDPDFEFDSLDKIADVIKSLRRYGRVESLFTILNEDEYEILKIMND